MSSRGLLLRSGFLRAEVSSVYFPNEAYYRTLSERDQRSLGCL